MPTDTKASASRIGGSSITLPKITAPVLQSYAFTGQNRLRLGAPARMGQPEWAGVSTDIGFARPCAGWATRPRLVPDRAIRAVIDALTQVLPGFEVRDVLA